MIYGFLSSPIKTNSWSNMQPYQEATEQVRKRAQDPKKALTAAGTIAGSIAGGSALASRVLPLLSSYIPGELMRKGLSKINPKIGAFVDTAINNGYGLDDVRDFMKEKFSTSESSELPQQQNQDQEHPIVKEAKIFESDFPQIAQAIANLMKSGRTPIESADIVEKSLPKEIKSMEKKMGKKFKDFITELFGNQPESMQQPQKPQQIQKEQPQQNQNESQGGIDPQLLQLVQGIRSSLQ